MDIWIFGENIKSEMKAISMLKAEYKVQFFTSKEQLLKASKSTLNFPSLIISDFYLFNSTYENILKKTRWKNIPHIILCSCKSENESEIQLAFDGGALDFFSKNISPVEFKIKVERFLKLNQKITVPRQGVLKNKNFVLSAERLSIERDGVILAKLTAKEYQILTMLDNSSKSPITRESIFSKIWNNTNVGAKTFDVHLFHLRKKLEGSGIHICFVRPDGYTLECFQEDDAVVSKIS